MYTSSLRRLQPRIEVEAFANEIVASKERHGVVLDLSESGVSLVRPYTGPIRQREVQLEFELPGVDEIIWAKGEVCYQQLRRGPGLGQVILQSGIRLVAAAARDLRTLQEYVLMKQRVLASDRAIAQGLASPWFALG